MIIKKIDILEDNLFIWSKTKNLKKLLDLGGIIPDFIAISSLIVKEVYGDKRKLDKLCQTIIDDFPQNKYAIRSSALIEDQDSNSMAGQFHTEINIDKSSLEDSILKVIGQAKNKLNNDLSKFSIIVQQYIDADFSWVCFTRSPNWEREMVFEYHKWVGEDLVWWKINPVKDCYYWNENAKILSFSTDRFKEIENKFGFPQDIEWCIKDEKMYFLQTRHITTISKEKYEEIRFLENSLDFKSDFCYEKTEIAEVAPRPTPFTLSLLNKIFWENGPVWNVYKKHKIDYNCKDIFVIIWNELFIDRDLEIKSLLPSCSILNKNYSYKVSSLKMIIKTLKNIFYLAIIKEDKKLIEKLKTWLSMKVSSWDFLDSLNNFLDQYEIILDINIFAWKYFKKLEILLKTEPINISDIFDVELNDFFEGNNFFEYKNDLKLIWNSLEILDETEFYGLKSGLRKNDNFNNWWANLWEFKKKLYKDAIVKALLYQRYREYTRILMIKNLNLIRDSILKNNWFKEKRNIYFQTIDEIINKKLDENICLERKKQYEKYNKYNFPNKLTYHYVNEKKDNIWISSGSAEWILLDEDNIDSESEKNIILYTKILSPELTKYFPIIKWIVSEKWWYLSHLSIVARENKIPVIISSNMKDYNIWDYIKIDWSNWKIIKI